jgi:hypothetical protein
MLAAEPNSDRFRAPQSVVLRVIKEGSWAEDPSTQNLWAGILFTACTLMGDDESNLPYIDLLAEMATVDTRLYIEACTKSKKLMAANGFVSAQPLMCSADDMIHLTGTHDLAKIDRNLLQLSILGLLEPRNKAKYFSFDQDANLQPTALGLELYARCQGHRGSPHEYFAPEASETTAPELESSSEPASDDTQTNV